MNAKVPCWIALIRAIGPGTHKSMSMAQLANACSDAGLQNVRTVLATGNVLFSSARLESELLEVLTAVIAKHGLHNEVILRQPRQLQAVLEADPFPEASAERPSQMLVLFLPRAPSNAEVASIESHRGPERLVVKGSDVFIDYLDGVGRSKLTSAKLERLLGQAGTARNWNTIRKLVETTSG